MDHAALFAAIPTPYLVMTPDLVIADANEAYLQVVGRSRDDLIGRPVFEAFPPQPDALDESGVSRVQRSFERARDTGLPDTMPLQKYDIADPATGQLVERFWSLISVPVLDDEGRTVLLLQRAEDVTDYVKERDRGQSAREQGQQWQRRIEEVEADLYARSLALQEAVTARDASARRLASLADVALQLSSAQTVEELAAVVADRGLSALGADGGAVGVRGDDGFVRLAITASLGEGAQEDYAELPLDGSLPASVTAATGERFILPDLAACQAWGPDMEGVVASTGCQAWACLPLEVDGRLLGSLAVGWAEPHDFAPAELEVLDALAAQCSQGLERIQVRHAERRSAAAVRRMSETLQRSLLTDPPQPDHLQIAVRYRPAAQEAQVGGDWYDAFLTADGATCLVIGDVAGHDRDAAAAMGQMRNLMRGVAYTLNEPPAAVLSALDRAIRDLAVGSLATAVLARVESVDPREGLGPSVRRLRWSNAGHPPPLVIDADGSTRLLRTEADLLLGLDPDTDRGDHEELLAPGSTLLLYTDGLVERREASLDDGLDRLQEVSGDLATVELSELCDRLLDLLGTQGNDDIALLALRAHPEDRPRPPEAGPRTVPGDRPGSTD